MGKTEGQISAETGISLLEYHCLRHLCADLSDAETLVRCEKLIRNCSTAGEMNAFARKHGWIKPLPSSAKQLLDALRLELESSLASKTGWGRNEIMQAFDRACVAVLAERVQVSK